MDGDPLAALELDELLEERAAALPAHAELYRQGRVAGTRELVVAPNYVLVYRIRPDGPSWRFSAYCMRGGSGRDVRIHCRLVSRRSTCYVHTWIYISARIG